MPNYCGNSVILRHDDPAMISRAKEAFVRGEFLNEFIPVPWDLQIVSGRLSDPVEQELLEVKEEANKKKYGYSTWYDFCVSEWGTKWDVGGSQGINDVSENELVVYFDSAWSPPVPAYERLEELGFTIYAMYYEPGMGYAGIYDEHGDTYYELSDMTSEQIRDELPPDLDSAFGISEAVAEWEYEQQDEVTTWYKDGVEDTGLTPHEPPKKESKNG